MATIKVTKNIDFLVDEHGNLVGSRNPRSATSADPLFADKMLGEGALPDPLLANIVPRQDSTLAALLATVDGQGEFAFATDQPAIVWLRSVGDGGPVTFAPVPVGAFPGANTLAMDVISAPTGLLLSSVSDINAIAGSVSTGSAGTLTFSAGNTDSAIPGESGGVVNFTAGLNTVDPTYNGYVSFGIGPAIPLILGTDSTGAGALAFFDGTLTTKPEVSGSKGGNAALGSLIAALASLGLITDSTT